LPCKAFDDTLVYNMATRIVSGYLREIWIGTQAGGAPAADIATGIRINTVQLSKLRGRLFIDSFIGAVAPTAVASIVGGLLHVAVASAGGTSFAYTLDVQLTHSVQQGLDPSAGAQIQIINGTVSASGGVAASTVYNAADFFTVTGAAADVTGMSLPVVTGHSYLVKVDALVAHATTAELAIGGAATVSSARLTHTLWESGVIQNAPSATLDPRLIAIVTKSAIGDSELVACPAQPGGIEAVLVHWQIEGMIIVNGSGDLRLRYRLAGAPSYHNQTLVVALSTMRIELIA
jgi:hypothetical protein